MRCVEALVWPLTAEDRDLENEDACRHEANAKCLSRIMHGLKLKTKSNTSLHLLRFGVSKSKMIIFMLWVLYLLVCVE